MKIRYNIDDKFVFVPQDNTLIKVENKSQHLSLGTNETRLLEYFVEHRNTTISRHELVSALWNNRDVYVNESSLRQSVSTLRKALGDSTKLPKFIKTVPKVGYEFMLSQTLFPLFQTNTVYSVKMNLILLTTAWLKAHLPPPI